MKEQLKTKKQVFISSTYLDLIVERQAAVQTILKSGNIPAGMELFTAGNKSQWEIIKKWIEESDIYMLILGGRYGSIEPNTGLSYTELEYDYALSLNKPFFSVVISDEGLEKKDINFIEKDNCEKFKAFRAKVLSKTSSFFTDYKDVKVAILESLPVLINENKITGWIRFDEIPDTSKLSDEIIQLSQDNRRLQKEIEGIKNKDVAEKINFEEIEGVLRNKIIKTADYPELEGFKAKYKTVTFLELMVLYKEKILNGVIDSYKENNFIFHSLCPHLQTFSLVKLGKGQLKYSKEYVITDKGLAFYAYLDKKYIKKNT